MKKRSLAFGLLLVLLVTSLAPVYADGAICDLSISEIRATSAEAAWNCTYKEDQTYILAYHVDGIDRDTIRYTSQTYYRLNYLCPATDYVLTVSTGNGGSSTISFTTPSAIDYVGYNYELLDTGLFLSAADKKDYTALSSLDSATLPGMVYDYDISFMLQFSMTASSVDKSLDCTLVLRLPNGDIYSINDMFWFTLKSATNTLYFPFTDMLEDIMADYSGFPAGEYTLTAYLEGDYAAEITFTMQ